MKKVCVILFLFLLISCRGKSTGTVVEAQQSKQVESTNSLEGTWVEYSNPTRFIDEDGIFKLPKVVEPSRVQAFQNLFLDEKYPEETWKWWSEVLLRDKEFVVWLEHPEALKKVTEHIKGSINYYYIRNRKYSELTWNLPQWKQPKNLTNAQKEKLLNSLWSIILSSIISRSYYNPSYQDWDRYMTNFEHMTINMLKVVREFWNPDLDKYELFYFTYCEGIDSNDQALNAKFIQGRIDRIEANFAKDDDLLSVLKNVELIRLRAYALLAINNEAPKNIWK